MIKLIIILTILLITFNIVYADTAYRDYIQKYEKDKLILSFLFSGKNLELKLKKENSSTIEYLPNTKNHTGIGVSYLGLGGSVSWRSGPSEKDELIYGKTGYVDYQLSYYGRKIGIDANYQEYSNFYLNNPDQYDSSWQAGDPYPQRTDLNIRYYSTNFYYIFSHRKFSFRAPFNQTERQIKKAGSFLLMTSLSYLDIKSDYSLIPANQETYFTDLSGFKGGSFTAIGLAPGYAYSFIFGKFYATPTIFLGPSYQYQIYKVAAGEKTSENAGVKGNVRLAGGYNSDTFFMGFATISDITSVKQGDITVESNTITAKMFMGYKF